MAPPSSSTSVIAVASSSTKLVGGSRPLLPATRAKRQRLRREREFAADRVIAAVGQWIDHPNDRAYVLACQSRYAEYQALPPIPTSDLD